MSGSGTHTRTTSTRTSNLLVSLVLQELRANRARLFFLAFCLAVGFGGLSGVTSYSHQIQETLAAKSRILFGGDVAVSDLRTLQEPERFAQLPEVSGSALVSQMTAMATHPKSGLTQLVNLRAVDLEYPLIPESLTLEPALPLPLDLKSEALAQAALVSKSLLDLWELRVDDSLVIAGQTYRIAAAITEDLTQTAAFFAFGPGVIVRRSDALAQGLFAHSSRFRESLVLRSESDPLRFAASLRVQLPAQSSVRVTTHKDTNRGPARVLSNLNFFLSQVSLSTFLLVSLGLATCLTEFIRSRRNDTAIYRVLGAVPQLPIHILMGVIVALSGTGIGLGIVLGEILRALLLLPLLRQALPLEAVPFRLSQIPLLAPLTGLVVPLLFVFPALRRLQAASPADVLRGGSPSALRPRSHVWAPVLALTLLFIHFVAGSPKPVLGAVIFALNLVLFGGVWLFLEGIIARTRTLKGSLPLVVELAFGEIVARKFTALLTMTLIGMGTFFVSMMLFIQSDLRESLSADITSSKKPNLYFLDVQKSQSDAVTQVIQKVLPEAGSIVAAPLVRARLVSVDGVTLEGQPEQRPALLRRILNAASRTDSADTSDDEGRNLRQREQNLTWRDAPGSSERIIAGGSQGALWEPGPTDQVSLERRFAERIGARLGSSLVFAISGIPITARVTSLREVDWQSFQPNFFVVMQPQMMTGVPHQVLMSVHGSSPDLRQRLQQEITKSFPNVSVLDATDVLQKAGEIATGVAQSSGALAGLLVIAALLILGASLLATGAARRRNGAILRTLGARNDLLRRAILLEFFVLGGLSAALGVLGAHVAAWLTLTHVLEIQSTLRVGNSLLLWFLATAATLVLGYWSGRSVMNQKPSETLRELV